MQSISFITFVRTPYVEFENVFSVSTCQHPSFFKISFCLILTSHYLSDVPVLLTGSAPLCLPIWLIIIYDLHQTCEIPSCFAAECRPNSFNYGQTWWCLWLVVKVTFSLWACIKLKHFVNTVSNMTNKVLHTDKEMISAFILSVCLSKFPLISCQAMLIILISSKDNMIISDMHVCKANVTAAVVAVTGYHVPQCFDVLLLIHTSVCCVSIKSSKCYILWVCGFSMINLTLKPHYPASAETERSSNEQVLTS